MILRQLINRLRPAQAEKAELTHDLFCDCRACVSDILNYAKALAEEK